MLPARSPVPLIGIKRQGFRYNRRDIAFDEPFEAVSPQDADILVKARLAKRPPEGDAAASSSSSAAAAATATDGGTRSPTAPTVVAAIAPGAPPRVRVRAPRKKNPRKAAAGGQASTEPSS